MDDWLKWIVLGHYGELPVLDVIMLTATGLAVVLVATACRWWHRRRGT